LFQHQHQVEDTACVPAPRRVPRPAAVFLHARALLHGGQPERVFAALDAIEHELRDDERGEAAILRGAALLALGRLEDGIAILRPAAASGKRARRNEAACVLAEAYVRVGRLDDADAVLSSILDSETQGDQYLARALASFGRVERARGRRTVAARYCLDALGALERASAAFPSPRNALLQDVVTLAVETLEPRLYVRVRRQAETAAADGPGFGALQQVRVLGELVCGKIPRAWNIAFAALRAAPSGIAEVSALLGMAAVARAAAEEFTPERLALAAADIAEHVDWQGADPDGRLRLLQLVGTLAPVDPGRSAVLLTAYESLRAEQFQTPDEVCAHAFARAALAGAKDVPGEQAALLQRAANVARDAGNAFAEAAALLALAAVRGDEETLRRADELTRPAPCSWLRVRFEALESRRELANLSPAERRVMLAICEGLSTLNIAERFGRSRNTIRNQTRRVYEVMNVRTRSALVSKCAALGLLSATASHGRESA
jgi:DNA-binding CsgD family transcriptional regulator